LLTMFKYKGLFSVRLVGKDCFGTSPVIRCFRTSMSFLLEANEKMVEVVKIGSDGILLQIKEVSDSYRDFPYRWDEDEN
jgi:hypothetical protein